MGLWKSNKVLINTITLQKFIFMSTFEVFIFPPSVSAKGVLYTGFQGLWSSSREAFVLEASEQGVAGNQLPV